MYGRIHSYNMNVKLGCTTPALQFRHRTHQRTNVPPRETQQRPVAGRGRCYHIHRYDSPGNLHEGTYSSIQWENRGIPGLWAHRGL